MFGKMSGIPEFPFDADHQRIIGDVLSHLSISTDLAAGNKGPGFEHFCENKVFKFPGLCSNPYLKYHYYLIHRIWMQLIRLQWVKHDQNLIMVMILYVFNAMVMVL